MYQFRKTRLAIAAIGAAVAGLLVPADATAQSGAGSHYATDKRLQVPITLKRRRDTIPYILGRLSKTARVTLTLDDNELERLEMLLECEQVPAYAVMDALSALYLNRWQRIGKDAYQLTGGQEYLDRVHLPRNSWEQERFAVGRELVRAMEQLPPAQRDAILSGGLAVSAMPAAMQGQVERMLRSLSQQLRERHGDGLGSTGQDLTREQVRAGRFSLSPVESGATPTYNFNFKGSGVNGSWRFNLYGTSQTVPSRTGSKTDKSGAAARSSIEQPVPVKRFEIKTTDAKRLPLMQRRVNLQLGDATFAQVLHRLHEAHQIPYLADPSVAEMGAARVSLVNVPLGEALDRLCKIYDDTEWEWREAGFLIVRGPKNHARHPIKGTSTTSGTMPAP